jgi:hypothetical protein
MLCPCLTAGACIHAAAFNCFQKQQMLLLLLLFVVVVLVKGQAAAEPNSNTLLETHVLFATAMKLYHPLQQLNDAKTHKYTGLSNSGQAGNNTCDG